MIKDIDCLLDVTKQREKKEKDEKKDEKKDPNPMKELEANKSVKLTLSGLLNVIDGLWSTCVDERIIIFTTNYVEKLVPTFIRRGRMDKHTELSYCRFEAFKALAKNYLSIDSHLLFAKIRQLLEETNKTSADVADSLMLKSVGEDEETNLKRLIKALEDAKEEARLKASYRPRI